MTRPRPLVPRGDPADSVRVVGEFGVIARVLAQAGTARAAQVGPGDDAAVLRAPDGRVVATTDVLVEGRHFRRDWSSAEDIGHKAAAANLADVAAMGATATALLVGLACPPDTPTTWLEGVAAGLAAECAPLGAAVVGGDLVTAAADSAAVVLSVTALGDLGGRAPVLRSGARAGDVLGPGHAGDLGDRGGDLGGLADFGLDEDVGVNHGRPFVGHNCRYVVPADWRTVREPTAATEVDR